MTRVGPYRDPPTYDDDRYPLHPDERAVGAHHRFYRGRERLWPEEYMDDEEDEVEEREERPEAMVAADQLVERAESPLERIEPPEWLKELATMARAAGADYITVPDAVRGRPGSILAIMLAGRELGLAPMESLRTVYVINGTPTVAAELKARWIREAGHGIEVLAQDHNRLRLRGVRADNGHTLEVEWAISRRDETSTPEPDATIAEEVVQQTRKGPQPITEKENWRMYPGDMLWARAVAQLHRRLFPDVRGSSVYASEEIDSDGH